jgi:hypothetical protein
MFKTPELISLAEKVSTSTWLTKIESCLIQLEIDMHHIRETQKERDDI